MEDQLRVCPPQDISESLMRSLFTKSGLGKIKRNQREVLKSPRPSNSSRLSYSRGGEGAGKRIL